MVEALFIQNDKGCFAMIKEHKSRFYIVRRCILMLICWHKYKIIEVEMVLSYVDSISISKENPTGGNVD